MLKFRAKSEETVSPIPAGNTIPTTSSGATASLLSAPTTLKKKRSGKRPNRLPFILLPLIVLTLVLGLCYNFIYPFRMTTNRIGLQIGIIKGPLAEAEDEFARQFPFPYDQKEQTPTSLRWTDIKDGEVITLSEGYAQTLQRMENLAAEYGKQAFSREFLDGYWIEMAKPFQPQRYVRIGSQWYQCGYSTEKPITVRDPATGKEYQRYIFSPVPQNALKGIHGIPPPPAPPGASAREIAEKYTMPRQETISYGPVNKQIRIPVRIQDYNHPSPYYPNDYQVSTPGTFIPAEDLDNHAREPWEESKK